MLAHHSNSGGWMWGSASFSLIVRSCDRAAPPHDSSQTARTWQPHGKVKADVLYLGNLDSCVTHVDMYLRWKDLELSAKAT
jgi:hypothetical protein